MLFAEKLELLLKLRDFEKITWSGKLRAAQRSRRLSAPRAEADSGVDRGWWHTAVGGARGDFGLPMGTAIIGGDPVRFAPYFALYRDSAQKAGHDPKTLGLSLNMHGFVAETREKAKSTFYGPQAEVMTRIGP